VINRDRKDCRKRERIGGLKSNETDTETERNEGKGRAMKKKITNERT
jgi:hypothetical protein